MRISMDQFPHWLEFHIIHFHSIHEFVQIESEIFIILYRTFRQLITYHFHHILARFNLLLERDSQVCIE